MQESNKQESQVNNEESTQQFFKGLGISRTLPESCDSTDFYSDLIGGGITVDHISRGNVSCSFTVKPCLTNYFNGLHGGAVAAVVERVAIACARTVVAEDKQLFLNEMSISYLSAAGLNAELVAHATLVRSGRNLTVVSIELLMKETAKLVYIGKATFIHLPASKL